MLRRELLFSTALVLLAGCTGSEQPDGPAVGTPTSGSTSPPATDTPTAVNDTPGPTEAQKPTETGEPAAETTTPDDPTETETMSAVEVRIEKAIGELDDVVDAYTRGSDAEDATILDTNAGSTDFSVGTVQAEANDALRAIHDADDINNGEYDTIIEELLDVRRFLRYAIETQGLLVDAYLRLDAARESFVEGSYKQIQTEKTEMRTKAADAKSVLSELKENSRPETTVHVPSLSPDLYEQKVAQFETEIDSFFALFDGLTEFADGLLLYALSMDEYNDNDDEYASFDSTNFRTARDLFAAAPRPESTASLSDAFECAASVYADAAVFMDGAATARSNHDVDSALDYEDQAEEALERDCT